MDKICQPQEYGQYKRGIYHIRPAVAHEPAVLFLDEPTASLDAIATQEIKNSLDAIKKDRTIIVISHNNSQIIDAEKVVVLDKGKVMEQGTHEELYARNGTYHEIFNAMAQSLNLDKISDTLNE